MSYLRTLSLHAALAVSAILFTAVQARADRVRINPIADATLIQVAPDANLGAANFFNAGTAGNGNRNRGLMQFSLAEVIPPGSVIINAYLTLDIVRQPTMDMISTTFDLRRVLVSWGEGDKVPIEEASPGLGAPGTDGDSTWTHRSVGGPAWTTPGGHIGIDFSSTVSSQTTVYGIGDLVEFESTPNIVADIQYWLDNPEANFGWVLLPEDERHRKSARSFASREDGSGGPILEIEFAPVPEPSTFALLGLGGLTLLAASRRRGTQR